MIRRGFELVTGVTLGVIVLVVGFAIQCILWGFGIAAVIWILGWVFGWT